MNDEQIEKWFLTAVILLSLFAVWSAYNTPMLGEDEEIYKYMGAEFAQGHFPVYYDFNFGEGVPFVQPVLMSLLFAPLFLLFGPSLAIAKTIVSLFFGLTLLMVYFIGKKYDMWCGIASVGILLTITYFSQFSLMVYMETPIAFFSALITYLILFDRRPITIGVACALAYYTKVSGILLIAVASLWYIRDHIRKFAVLLVFGVCMLPYLAKNMLLYNYPYFEPFNPLFTYVSHVPQWIWSSLALVSPVSLSPMAILTSLGWIATFFAIMAIPYFKLTDDKGLLKLCMISVGLFLLMFIAAAITHFTVVDYRHFSIIYPQIALMGGFWLWKLKEYKSGMALLIVVIIIMGFWTSYSTISAVSHGTRYSAAYLDSMKWIDKNTPADARVLTTFIGSCMEYSHRTCLWSIEELESMMTGGDIYTPMKAHDIDYIFIYGPLVNNQFIVPQANLLGTFTTSYVERISADSRFSVVYQNAEGAVFKVG